MTDQFKILGAPGRYVQGQGALSLLPEITSELSPPALVIADDIVLQIVREDLHSTFAAKDIPCGFSQFSGECTRAEIDRQAECARALDSGVVIAIGGGKAIDTAKGVSLALDIPIVIAPSIASNDAPTSRLIVVYDEEHRISEVLKLPRNPDYVVVDTALIAQAPPRFLVAGIGDAIAKKFEAEQCLATNALNFFGGLPTHTAIALCRTCYSIIREHGVSAVDAVRNGTVDEHLESVIEANVLLSGLGFESGGLALAHSLTRGLTARSETQSALHGELVAWGLLVQLIAEERPASFVEDIREFYRAVGLPLSLNDIGFTDANEEAIQTIAGVTHAEAPYIKNLEKPLSLDRLVSCIHAVEGM